MRRLLEGRTAVVTGCDSGIGFQTVKKFVAEGATVYANILKEESQYGIIEECSSLEGECIPVAFDIRDSKSIFECMKRIKNEYGKLDILVNNAGVIYDGLFEMIRRDDFENMMDINVFAPYDLTKQVLRLLRKSEYGGVIINISSVVGLYGNIGQSAYGATKGAIASITKSWAKEFSKYGIRVNAVSPGSIDTGMFHMYTEETMRKSIESTCLRRVGSPDEVADAILFLASDMSSYITGQIIRVDGGMAM